MRWSFVHTAPLPGPVNMAVDEALLERARLTHQGVIRVYSWGTPTVSLGRNQRALGGFDAVRLAEAEDFGAGGGFVRVAPAGVNPHWR